MRVESGGFVADGRDGRVGVVVVREGAQVVLRSPGGGVWWRCPVAVLCVATGAALLAARVRELNWRSRMP